MWIYGRMTPISWIMTNKEMSKTKKSYSKMKKGGIVYSFIFLLLRYARCNYNGISARNVGKSLVPSPKSKFLLKASSHPLNKGRGWVDFKSQSKFESLGVGDSSWVQVKSCCQWDLRPTWQQALWLESLSLKTAVMNCCYERSCYLYSMLCATCATCVLIVWIHVVVS